MIRDKLVIMGPQGSGKGTQAKRLKERFDFIHISVGDILRWNIQSHTKLGGRIRRVIAAGLMAPDEVVTQLVRERLDQHDWNHGFVLDGYPRNRTQAEALLESYNLDGVIYIDVPDEVVFDRVLARRICSRCGLDYNLIAHRPAVPGVCDVCGGQLVPREDDKPEAIRRRLADYHHQTRPALDLFHRRTAVLVVDGTHTEDVVHERVSAWLQAPDT